MASKTFNLGPRISLISNLTNKTHESYAKYVIIIKLNTIYNADILKIDVQ